MIWHILRKDVAQLWKVAAIVAFAQVTNSTLFILLGPFMEPAGLRSLAQLFPYVAMFATATLAALAVQQDVVPGTSADWLIRPIGRRDVLLAKLLFVVLLGVAPVMIMAFVEVLASGFDISRALQVAATAGLSTFLMICLPAMALAAVTQSLTELLLAALALVVAASVLLVVSTLFLGGAPALSGSGLVWIRSHLVVALLAVVAVAVFLLQYGRRNTPLSRRVIATAVIAYALVWECLPWDSSYALLRFVGPTSTGPAIKMAPVAPAQTPGAQLRRDATPPASGEQLQLSLPVSFAKVPDDSILVLDGARIRLLDAHGKVLKEEFTRQFANGEPRIRPARRSRDGQGTSQWQAFHQISVPAQLFSGGTRRAVHLQIQYFLTDLRARMLAPVPAMGGKIDDRDVQCQSRMNFDGKSIRLGCLAAGTLPSCMEVALVGAVPAAQSASGGCLPDYSPLRLEIVPPLVTRIGMVVRSPNKSGGARSVLEASRLAVAVYRPRQHFERTIDVLNFEPSRFPVVLLDSDDRSGCLERDARSAERCAEKARAD